MEYLTWNDRLAARFFNQANEYRRVYLFVTRELIADIASDCDSPVADFISAVKHGPSWTSPGNVCGKAEETCAAWRFRRKRPYPPYVGYLALFSLAAGIESDFAVHAYYPRLRSLLGETAVSGPYPGFSRIRALWKDLDTWTQEDQQGRLGVFRSDTHNRLVHVGLPIAQTILSETERAVLPAVFAAAGLDSSATPADAVLTQSLFDHQQYLRPRTRRILTGTNNHREELAALIEAAADALAEWDGTSSDLQSTSSPGPIFGRAVLWCEDVDTVAETVDMRLLCRTRNEFPEQGLSIEVSDIDGLFCCEESRLGWSTPLQSPQGRPFDASRLDWAAGARLRDANTKWSFKLPPAAVRLFVSAEADHLSGFIETYTLLPNNPFFLLVREEHCSVVEQWGHSSCAGFKHLRIRSGLPGGWRAYSADGATSDTAVRSHFSVLSFPRTSRITPQAGLVASPSSYFFFALPDILVTGVPDTAELFCNNERVGPCKGAPLPLPETAIHTKRLHLEARLGAQALCRRSIYTERAVLWPFKDPSFWSDRFGDATAADNLTRVSGAIVYSTDVPDFADWLIRNDTPPSTDDRVDTSHPSAGTHAAPAIEPEALAPPLSDANARALLTQWHREVEGQRVERSAQSLTVRDLGTSLTEGCIQYVTGCAPGGNSRNFSRAISELRRATSSSDPLVATAARALLLLALYRSGRVPEVPSSGVSEAPQFDRLHSFMALLAGRPCDVPSLNGIGIGDISPLNEDGALERRLFVSAVARP